MRREETSLVLHESEHGRCIQQNYEADGRLMDILTQVEFSGIKEFDVESQMHP